ncbi:MAG: hypothetical protein ACOYXY_13455 [Thermodesulfobacteriota bacterium]
MTRIVDGTLNRLHQLVAEQATGGNWEAFLRDMDEAIREKVRRPPVPDVDMLEFLHTCRQFIEGELASWVSGWSAARWLWYLRRLPRHVFARELSTTYGYDSALAEVVSAESRAPDTTKRPSGAMLAYDINDSVVRRLVRYSYRIKALSQTHVLIRLANKGVKLVHDKYALPEDKMTSEQKEAISLYDRRTALGGHPLGRVGTIVASEDLGGDYSTSILAVALNGAPDWAPAPLGPVTAEHAQVEVLMNFVPRLISLNQLQKLNSDPALAAKQRWTPDTALLLLLMRNAVSLLVNLDAGILNVLQYGYFVVEDAMFHAIIQARLAESSAMVQSVIPGAQMPSSSIEFLASLEALRGSSWPLRHGPPIRRVDGLVMVDLHAATSATNSLFEFPRRFPLSSGEVDPSNIRGEHFEDAVQRLIDSSPWCPPSDLKDLRGRHLIYDRKRVTDVDAIGAKGDRLLMVSCKSMIYSAEYDAGEAAAVRNVASTIEQAWSQWKGKKAFLEAHPKGDNYDFTEYKRIVGVVCTPNVFYVPLGPATDLVAPGLMAVSSFSELRTWLTLGES